MAEDPRSLGHARGPRPLSPPPAAPEVESRYGIYPQERELRRVHRHPHRRYLPMAVALAVLLLFCGVLWYSYTWSVGEVPTASLPVIEAAPGAEKVRPESPGGLEVPYQDKLVLNQTTPDPAQPQVERLLPPPEIPQALSVEPVAPAADAPAPAASAPTTPAPDEPAADQAADAPPAPETAIAEAPPSAPASTDPPAVPVPDVSAALSQALNEPPPQASADPVETAAPPVQTQAPKQAPAPAPQVAALPSGVLVQLASLKSENSARTAWERLKAAHPSVIGPLSLKVEKADLGERGVFYRVQAGPFADRAAAEKVCTTLKAEQQDCLVVVR